MRAGRATLAGAVAVVGLAGCGGSSDEPAPAGDPAVLRVLAGAGPGAEDAVGTAVGGDRVLTVAHVLSGRLRVVLPSGEVTRACVLARAPASDAAVLQAPGLSAPAIRLAGGVATRRVVSLRDGRPLSRPPRGERSLVAKVRGPGGASPARRPVLRLGVGARAGDSGSPAFDATGRLTGMVFAARTGSTAVAYATAAAALGPVIARGARDEAGC